MIANILLVIAMFFLIIGAIGINKLEGIFPKLLTSSLIDTMAMLALILALMIKSGWNSMSVKLGIVMLFILLTNPVINHIITQAAHEEQKK
ncbi:MAG: monovalent cation/H(+) antiporter subunit G [Clostridiales bacterium]|nr:monovalent cation/H(+) antiporter subunit G [Clostridiales bacterium]